MKNFFLALALAACAVQIPESSFSQVPGWPAGNGIGNQDQNSTLFGGGGVAQACTVDSGAGNISNAMWFCTSANVAGAPIIYTINALSDLLCDASIKFYTSTNQTTVTNTTAANTTNGFSVASTNGLVKGDFLLLRGVTNDTYQFLIISNFLTTNVVLTYQTYSNAIGVGDIVYEMTQASTFCPRLPGSVEYTSGVPRSVTYTAAQGIFAGPLSTPLMVQVVSSNSANLGLSVSGEYYRRQRP